MPWYIEKYTILPYVWQRVKRGAKMSDLNMNFGKLNKACKEVNEKWREMMKENNPLDTISNIAKDIQDREDKEMAYELVKRLSPLLIANSVTVKTTKYNLDEQVAVKEASSIDPFKKELVIHYGISIDGLDFTEHDKAFGDKIASLEENVGYYKDSLSRVEKNCDKLYHENKELKQRIAELENKETVELPFDALETANMLINAT